MILRPFLTLTDGSLPITGGGEDFASKPARKALGDTNNFDEGFSAAVVLLFLIYPSTWKQILIVFSCFTLDEVDYDPSASSFVELLPELEVLTPGKIHVIQIVRYPPLSLGLFVTYIFSGSR